MTFFIYNEVLDERHFIQVKSIASSEKHTIIKYNNNNNSRLNLKGPKAALHEVNTDKKKQTKKQVGQNIKVKMINITNNSNKKYVTR